MATLQSILDQQLDGSAPINQKDEVRLKDAAKPLVEWLKKQAKAKKREKDNDYYVRVRRCIAALNNAHRSIESADDLLAECSLNHEDVSQINKRIFDTLGIHDGLSEIRSRIQHGRDYCSFLASMISDATGAPEKRWRGRPANQYVYETRKLMHFYEWATKKRVVFPKQIPAIEKSENASQYSTEFIKLRLREIDSNITLAKTITCIKNALKLEANIGKILAKSTKGTPRK